MTGFSGRFGLLQNEDVGMQKHCRLEQLQFSVPNLAFSSMDVVVLELEQSDAWQ